jgi:hypothetical protein
MFVKHQRLRTQYQSTTHSLLIHHQFTGTFTGTENITNCLIHCHIDAGLPERAVDCAHFAPPMGGLVLRISLWCCVFPRLTIAITMCLEADL